MSGGSSKVLGKCGSFLIRCQCVCISCLSCGSKGVYAVTNGGVYSFSLYLSSKVLDLVPNGMLRCSMNLLGKCLCLRCCLWVSTSCAYFVGSEFVLKKCMHSPLATDLYVVSGWHESPCTY